MEMNGTDYHCFTVKIDLGCLHFPHSIIALNQQISFEVGPQMNPFVQCTFLPEVFPFPIPFSTADLAYFSLLSELLHSKFLAALLSVS